MHLARIRAVERCRDPVFHLMPTALRVLVDDGAPLTFGSFEDREEAYALIRRLLAGSAVAETARGGGERTTVPGAGKKQGVG